MMRARARKTTVAIGVVMTLAMMASCREPTQVIVEAHSNVVYQSGLVVSFTVGTPSETESAVPTTETSDPWGADGFVGSLTVVPGSADDAALAVKLVLGLHRRARDCMAPRYDGCIVARRRLRYTPHERLHLPINLYLRCEGVPCDADTTCNALGTCVTAQVDPDSCSGPEGCRISGDVPAAGDSGVDTGTLSESGVDARSDASVDAPSDAPVDASNDSAVMDGGTPGKIECGSTYCLIPSQQCCFSEGAGIGMCQALGAICYPPAQTVRCDGKEDCGGGYCCQNSGGLNCGTVCSGPEVCHSDHKCYAGGQCMFSGHFGTCQ